MSQASDYLENFLIDGLFRGGAVNAGGTVNSTAVVKGLWASGTAYALGDIVVPVANTSAGGKFLLCTTAGTSGGTFTTALGNPGATVADNTVTWTVLSGMPSRTAVYIGLFTANPSDSGGGTEVAGNNYSRASVACTLAAWAGTQSAGSTTSSSGTGGATSNNAAITFATPSASWGTITGIGIFDKSTGGNLLAWSALATSKVVNSGDAPQFAIGDLDLTIA